MMYWFRSLDVLKCTVEPFKKDFVKEVLVKGNGKGWAILSVDRIRYRQGPHPHQESVKHWIPGEKSRDDVLGPPRIVVLYVAVRTKILGKLARCREEMALKVIKAVWDIFDISPNAYSIRTTKNWGTKESRKTRGIFHDDVELIFGMEK